MNSDLRQALDRRVTAIERQKEQQLTASTPQIPNELLRLAEHLDKAVKGIQRERGGFFARVPGVGRHLSALFEKPLPHLLENVPASLLIQTADRFRKAASEIAKGNVAEGISNCSEARKSADEVIGDLCRIAQTGDTRAELRLAETFLAVKGSRDRLDTLL